MPKKKLITVEVFADIICPWCYIGKKRLDAAFAARPHITPHYIWRTFLLNPNMPENGMDRQAYLDQKFGSAATTIYDRIAIAGLESGIEFEFDKIKRTPNTMNSHRLLLLEQQNTNLLSEVFYHAYFVDGKDIGDPNVLDEIIFTAGLEIDKDSAQTNSINRQLENDLFIGQQLQLDGVPYLIFDKKFSVAGALMPNQLIPVIDAATS